MRPEKRELIRWAVGGIIFGLVLFALLSPQCAHAAVVINDQQGALSGTAKLDLENTSTNHRVVANFVDASSKAELDGMMSRCITRGIARRRPLLQ